MFSLFYKLPKNILNCFRWHNLLWQIGACLITFILVNTGFDWWYYQVTRGSLVQTLAWPAVFLGFFIPVLLPVVLLLVGLIRKNGGLKNTAFAIGQAGLVGLGLSSLYKFFTGRMGPHSLSFMETTLSDITHNFRFGFDRGGAFQGWPSSHTTVAFAMSMVLVALYPNNKWVKYVAIIYAVYIGIGISVNIHWFSDFVAGAIFGTVTGLVIGKVFRNRPVFGTL